MCYRPSSRLLCQSKTNGTQSVGACDNFGGFTGHKIDLLRPLLSLLVYSRAPLNVFSNIYLFIYYYCYSSLCFLSLCVSVIFFLQEISLYTHSARIANTRGSLREIVLRIKFYRHNSSGSGNNNSSSSSSSSDAGSLIPIKLRPECALARAVVPRGMWIGRYEEEQKKKKKQLPPSALPRTCARIKRVYKFEMSHIFFSEFDVYCIRWPLPRVLFWRSHVLSLNTVFRFLQRISLVGIRFIYIALGIPPPVD